MTITLGWWLIPLAITIMAFIKAGVVKTSSSGGTFDHIAASIEFIINYGLALVVSLISWVIFFGVSYAIL